MVGKFTWQNINGRKVLNWIKIIEEKSFKKWQQNCWKQWKNSGKFWEKKGNGGKTSHENSGNKLKCWKMIGKFPLQKQKLLKWKVFRKWQKIRENFSLFK